MMSSLPSIPPFPPKAPPFWPVRQAPLLGSLGVGRRSDADKRATRVTARKSPPSVECRNDEPFMIDELGGHLRCRGGGTWPGLPDRRTMVLEERTNQKGWFEYLGLDTQFFRCGGRNKCKAARSRKKSRTPPHSSNQLSKGSSIIGLSALEGLEALPAWLISSSPRTDQPEVLVSSRKTRPIREVVCAHCRASINGTVFMGLDRAYCSTPDPPQT